MKTAKVLWSALLSTVLVLAMVLGFGFTGTNTYVKAEEDEHITFNVTVDDLSSKSIALPYSDEIVVKYTVAENTGVDALQLALSYDNTAFTLVGVSTDDTTALGASEIGEDENHVFTGNVVFDNVKTTGGGAVYTATGDTLITARFVIKQNATPFGAYNFGLVDVNDGTDFSNAWRVEKSAEETSTHTPVTILYDAPTLFVRGDFDFELGGATKAYDGVAAQDSEITVSNASAHTPTINFVWFDYNGETYTKLDTRPVNVGTYYVVAQTEQTDYWNAYCGYTYEGGVYTLTDDEDKVAVYTINRRALTIAFDARSEEYKTFDNTTFAGYLQEEGYLTITNLVAGETLTLSLDATNILTAVVGNYGYVSDIVFTLADGTGLASNYTAGTVSGTFTITQKEITLGESVYAVFNNGSFNYDGEPHKITATIADAYKSILSATYTGGENGANGRTSVGIDTITATFTISNSNYKFKDDVNTLTATLEIVQTALTQQQVDDLVNAYVSFYAVDGGTENLLTIVNHAGSYTKTYDTQSTFIGVIVDRVNQSKLTSTVLYKDGDELAVEESAISLSNFSDYNKVNAGVYTVVITVQPATGYAFAANVNAAYTITLTINRAALTITATGSVQYSDDAPVITVDNGTNAWQGTENYATYNTSAEALKQYVTTTYANTMTAGTAYALAWVEGAKTTIEAILVNYNVNLAVATDLAVAKKIINASAYDFTGYENAYDGSTHTLTVAGANDFITYTIADANTVKNVVDSGTYTATITLADSANYTFEDGNNDGWTVDGNSATKSASVTITAVELTINVAYTAKTATFTVVGFVGEETESVLTNLAYLADGASDNIEVNVYTISAYVASAITVSATSENTNYTIANATLKNIRKVEYVAGSYDAEISGENPELPATDLLFDGFTTAEPEAVQLYHYTFVRFAVDADNTAAFNFTQAVNANKKVYVIWEINEQYTLTLFYMIEGDVENLIKLSETDYFSDDEIDYNVELPSLTAKAWFKVQEWFTDTALTEKFAGGIVLTEDTALYANYKFNVGLGDVNGNGFVNANDITLYRQWIVGGYEMEVVEKGDEWTVVNSNGFDAENVYFIKRVADNNALNAESLVLGDNHLDIRDVSTIRMALVGGYGFSVLEGKYVDGEEIIVTRTISTDNASDLLLLAKSGMVIQLADDINEPLFVGALANCRKDVVIDLNGHKLTLKSLSIALAAGNTGKIEIKNGSIYVSEGNGINLTAPDGSVILDNVTLYDKNGEFTIQAADHSLHFANAVKFLKDDNGTEVKAAVKVEKDTHVVLEETAEVTVDKLVVTKNFVASTSEDAEISLFVKGEPENAIVIEGNFKNEIATLAELVIAAEKGGEYTLSADLVYRGQVVVKADTVLNLNDHTVSSTNNVALAAIGNVKLTLNGTGAVVAQEACVMAFDGAEVVINGGTYTSKDNFVVGTNGSTGRGGNTITINAGTFNGGIQSAGYVACGIYAANNDTIVVNGGTFNITDGVGILARSGNTTVNEGVVINNLGDNAISGWVGDNKLAIPSGYAIVLDLASNYPGGTPTVTNNSDNEVAVFVESVADIDAVRAWADAIIVAKDILVDDNDYIIFRKDIVLDLNGKAITDNDGVAIYVASGATLTINGNGSVTAQEACVMVLEGSALIVNGGTYTAKDNFVLGTNGSAGKGNNKITVNAGTFNGGIESEGYVACGIYVANSDTVVVNGGTFNITDGCGILARSGNTTVKAGVVFNMLGDTTATGKVGDSRVVVPAGEALVLDLKAAYPGGVPTINNETDIEVYVIVDGTYTFAGDDASFHAARGVYDNVILNGDFNDYLYVNADMTVYLNGHTVDASGTSYVAIYVVNGAKLTINGNGNVLAREGCVLVLDGSELVVNGGTYTCYDNFVFGTNGSAGKGNNKITVNAGTFNGGIVSEGYVACGIYVANSDTVVVNGGTFNITDGCGILARSGNTTVKAGAVFNMLGDTTATGKVGDSRVVVPAGEALVLDLKAAYPGGEPTIANTSSYTVYTIND